MPFCIVLHLFRYFDELCDVRSVFLFNLQIVRLIPFIKCAI